MAVLRENPYPGFDFQVEISGGEASAFQEVTGLGADIGVIEYRNGDDKERLVRKQPGLRTYGPITLRRGLIGDLSLWEWFDAAGRSDVVDRRDMVIKLLDEAHQPVLAWEIRNAWVSSWSGPSLDATLNAVAIETIEITHEGFQLA